MTIPITKELKDTYAVCLAQQPQNPWNAAILATGGNVGLAMELQLDCDRDPIWKARTQEILKEHGYADLLPSKEQVALEILTISRIAADRETQLKGYRLYGEMMGLIEKGGPQTNIQVNNPKVLVMKDFGDQNSWERVALEQQKKLTSVR
jgi:hypothetical protein